MTLKLQYKLIEKGEERKPRILKEQTTFERTFYRLIQSQRLNTTFNDLLILPFNLNEQNNLAETNP